MKKRFERLPQGQVNEPHFITKLNEVNCASAFSLTEFCMVILFQNGFYRFSVHHGQNGTLVPRISLVPIRIPISKYDCNLEMGPLKT